MTSVEGTLGQWLMGKGTLDQWLVGKGTVGQWLVWKEHLTNGWWGRGYTDNG